jgi:hypothetical protein
MTKRLGPFVDDFGDLSLGRIIVFMVTLLGMLIVLEGGALLAYETIAATKTNNGFSLAGLGVSLIGFAFGLKGWQRQAESRIAIALQAGAPPAGAAPQPAGS